ncbi:hypothetical protein FOB41_15150 [Agrobacterium pusense]|uniref:Uncharacterized protein n=1 Tax=Agrobacterium pusense TaxID=648995 RepID=A0A6H0ZNK1_9HYPH|nr:hypothetical protein [Agrobacterium pusense]MBM7324138.1 hypothetical protein [Agrobacterium sp. S2]QIX22386.1 hypothetical protein FOB41_15150 [Agrobacterium pusense]
MIPNRTTLYRHTNGSEMTPQERLAFLLDIGGLDYKAAAVIAGVAPLTIKAYRRPSSTRNVPDTILAPIERHVFRRLADIIMAAGYDVRPAA